MKKPNKIMQRIMVMTVLMIGLFAVGLSSNYGQDYQYTTVLPTTPLSGDVYTIHAAPNPNFVLTTYNHDAGVTDGTSVSLWENSNNKGQQWVIVPTGDKDLVWYGKKYPQYYIIGRASGLMLGHNSKIYAYDPKNVYLKWLFIPKSNGYILKPVAEKDRALTKNVSVVGNGSNIELNWFDQAMEFKLSKKTEFTVPTETSSSNTDRLNSDSLKIRWQNGQPIFPETKKPFATIQTYIPGYMVTDPNISSVDKMNISPFYILQKESFPNEVIKFDNSGNASQARPNYSYSAGITKSQSTSRTQTFGISVTVGTGETSPIQASVTASYESAWTTEESTGTENTTTKGAEFDVEPGHAAALYTIKYVFTVKRKDGEIVNTWEVFGPADFKPISSAKSD